MGNVPAGRGMVVTASFYRGAFARVKDGRGRGGSVFGGLGRLGLGLLVPARLRLGLGLRAVPGLGRGAALLGVIRDVPAVALELDGRRRDELAQRAAALRADVEGLVLGLLQGLELVPALGALVFVEWHDR